jgi:hypothetical protein
MASTPLDAAMPDKKHLRSSQIIRRDAMSGLLLFVRRSRWPVCEISNYHLIPILL